MLLSGENFSAHEADSWGLVNELVADDDLNDAVGRWLDQLLSCSPGAVRLQKQLIRSWEDLPLRAAIEAGNERFEWAVRWGGCPAPKVRICWRREERGSRHL